MVTNAHVVWPFDRADIAFPNAEAHLDVPLLNWDLMADLAILGPIETDVVPAALVNGEGSAVGSDTFLIGYPVGMESHPPQPAITRGLLSRMREWESVGVTYFQTDATIEGGQSGGVLTSDKGEIIGISGLSLGDFALSASSGDLLPRIQQLIVGGDASGLGQRRVPKQGGLREQRFPLDNWWEEQAFVIDAPLGEVVEIELYGHEDSYFAGYDSAGIELEFDETDTGVYTVTIEYDEPHFLIAWQESEEPNEFQFVSNRKLIPFDDPDDGKQVKAGQTIHGNLDYPSDVDYYLIDLEARSKIEIMVDSLLIDPYLQVDFKGASSEEIVYDDDSGGGLWGLNAQLVYRAPISASYFIVISESSDELITGGYILSVTDVTKR